MKKEDLIDAIGNIDGKYVVEAEYEGKIKKKSKITRLKYQAWISLAACLCILVAAGYAGGRYFMRVERGPIEGVAEAAMENEVTELESAVAEDTIVENATTEENVREGMASGDAIIEEKEETDTATKGQLQSATQEKSDMNASKDSAANETILTEPPEMTVMYLYDGTEVSIHSGASSWSYRINENEWSSMETDAEHPLYQKYDASNTIELANKKESDTGVMRFNFDVTPERIEVLNCWKVGAKVTESVEAIKTRSVNEFIPFTDGDYIYEVAAYWDCEEYRGTAYYCFRTGIPK